MLPRILYDCYVDTKNFVRETARCDLEDGDGFEVCDPLVGHPVLFPQRRLREEGGEREGARERGGGSERVGERERGRDSVWVCRLPHTTSQHYYTTIQRYIAAYDISCRPPRTSPAVPPASNLQSVTTIIPSYISQHYHTIIRISSQHYQTIMCTSSQHFNTACPIPPVSTISLRFSTK